MSGEEVVQEPPVQGSQGSSSRQNNTATVKCVHVCPNGSRYGKIKKVVVPARLRSRWEGVLQLIDDSVPIFGGCFNLVKVGDAGDFTKITEYDEIEDNELYVALNNTEKLVKIDYKSLLNNSRSPSPPRRSQQSTASRKPRQRNRVEVESKFLKILPRITINLYANGIYHVKHKATLDHAEVYERRATVFRNKICPAMEFVYRDIEDSCRITLPRNQSIRKMVDSRNGKVISTPREIEEGQTYVLCGNEEYREFDGMKTVHRLQFGRFSHDHQRFLNNPRSAKVGAKTSRKQKNQDTARDTAREEKPTAREENENGFTDRNGYNQTSYETHPGHDAYNTDPYGQQHNDPYAHNSTEHNGFEAYENGDDHLEQSQSNEGPANEYDTLPRFGDADAPLLTDPKANEEPTNEELKPQVSLKSANQNDGGNHDSNLNTRRDTLQGGQEVTGNVGEA